MKKTLVLLAIAVIVFQGFALLAPTVNAQDQHDISMVSVATNTFHEYPGRIVNITVMVKNNGTVSESFNVTAYRNVTEIGKILVTDLPSGDNTTVIFNWNTIGLIPGQNWTISAEAPLNEDLNPDDNNMTDGWVEIMNYDDIAVISVATNTPHEYPGRIVNITVVVENKGTVAEDFNVTAHRNGTEIGRIEVPNLLPGANTTVVFDWNTTGLARGQNWTIEARAPLLGDLNPSDNNLTDGTVFIKMLGDFNADREINIFDIVAAAIIFGSTSSGSNWDPQADILADGVIDVFDLVEISQVFGEKY